MNALGRSGAFSEGERHGQLGALLRQLSSGDTPVQTRRNALQQATQMVSAWPDGLYHGWIERLEEVAGGIERTADAQLAESAKVLTAACAEALKHADPHGQMMGILYNPDNSRGYCLRVAAGQQHAPKLASDTVNSFNEARRAVVALVNEKLVPFGQSVDVNTASLRAIKASLPGEEQPVEGPSAGLPFALCILSRLFQSLLGTDPAWSRTYQQGGFRIAADLSATGHLDDRGVPQSLNDLEGVQTKLRAAAEGLPRPDKATVVIFKVDAPRFLPTVPRVLSVENLQQAAAAAFPLLAGAEYNLDAVLLAVGQRLASETKRDAATSFFDSIKADPRFQPALVYCDRDETMFVLATCYFGFCAEHLRQLARAPEDWPSCHDDLIDDPASGSNRKTGQLNGLAMAYRLLVGAAEKGSPIFPAGTTEERVAVARAVYARLVDYFERDWSNTHEHDVISAAKQGAILMPELFIPSIRERAEDRLDVQKSYLEAVKRNIISGPSHRSFAALVAELAPHLRPTLRDIFGRRIQIEAISPGRVGSEEAMHDGRAAVNATLGGAWMLKYVVPYLAQNRRRPSDLMQSFDIKWPTPEEQEAFWGGIMDGVDSQEFAAFFNERPFHPRVLWEVLSGGNERYPAESLLVQDCLRHFAQNDCAAFHVFWSYELVPIVADLRLDDQSELPVPWLGQLAVQDYAAYGRTNHSNTFLKVPSFGDLQVREFLPGEWPNPWVVREGEEAALERDVFWQFGDGREDGWSVYALNARTSTISAAEALRKQVLLNRFLDPGIEVADLRSSELLSVPWFSLALSMVSTEREKSSLRSLMEHLSGRSAKLTDVTNGLDQFGQTSFLPLFWDPFTWRGVGVASGWAYDATVAVILQRALRQLASTSALLA